MYREVVDHLGAGRDLRLRANMALNPIRRGQLASATLTDGFGLIHVRTAHAWLAAMTCSNRWAWRPNGSGGVGQPDVVIDSNLHALSEFWGDGTCPRVEPYDRDALDLR